MNTLIKDPSLKIRYAMGLGDFVASVLHSRLVGRLTKLITGKDKPCSTCSKRAQALNILFPIPFWRLFFTTKENMLASYQKDLEASGYKVTVSPDGKMVSGVKTNFANTLEPVNSSPSLFPPLPTAPRDEDIFNTHNLINKYDTRSGDFLIRTQIFKTK